MQIKIEPALGLGVLQRNALAKQELIKEIAVECTKIATFIKEEKLNENLNRRCQQIDKRDFRLLHRDSNFEKAKVFCYNGSSLSWEKSLEMLPYNLPFNGIFVDHTCGKYLRI